MTNRDDSGWCRGLENLVLYMTEARGEFNGRRSLMELDGAVPILSYLPPIDDDPENVLLPAADFRPTSLGNWGAKILQEVSNADGTLNPNNFAGFRFRSIHSREARTATWAPREFARHMVSAKIYGIFENGLYTEIPLFLGHTGHEGDEWRILRSASPRRKECDRYLEKHWDWDHLIRTSQSITFSRHFLWNALVGLEGHPRVSLCTDAVGAQELFRLRDVPSGATRRAALLHWVGEHWRRNRKDPALETQVRAHLRGATEFTWNGLYVKLTPSQADLNKAEELRGLRAR